MQNENNKIIVNTGILFAKLLVCVFLGLFQTRYVLGALGTSDFGIFSLVGSCVAMLSFLNAAMSMSAQRFISYSIGTRDPQKTEVTYASAKKLLRWIAVGVFIFLELVLFFLFDELFDVPENRLLAAKIVFQSVVLSSFFTIVSVPLDAVMNAYENMLAVAAFSLLDVVLRFVCAVSLFFIPTDSLITWSVMLISVAALLYLLKFLYCKHKYRPLICHREKSSRKLLREIFSFTLFNSFSSLSGVAKNSGIAVVLGMFFPTVVNAAYGIANQVNGQVMNFSHMLLKAVTPQIVKSESSNNHQRSLKLSTSSCKFSFYLISFFAFPLIVNMPFVLKVWLKEVPDWTVIFCQLVLVLSMIGQMTLPLFYFVQAIGNIKLYQLSLGGLQIANIPAIYILCCLGYSPVAAIVSTIVVEGIAGVLRIFYAKKYGAMDVIQFIFRNVLPCCIVIAAAVLCMRFNSETNGFFYFVESSLVSEIILGIFVWIVLFDKAEKNTMLGFIDSLKKKIYHVLKGRG